MGGKVKANKEDIEIGERISINLNSYLLLKEILTQMKLAYELGDSQHWVMIGVDGPAYCIANWQCKEISHFYGIIFSLSNVNA